MIGPGGRGLVGKGDATPTSTNIKTDHPSNGVTSDGEGMADPTPIDVDVVFEGEEGEWDGAPFSSTPGTYVHMCLVSIILH